MGSYPAVRAGVLCKTILSLSLTLSTTKWQRSPLYLIHTHLRRRCEKTKALGSAVIPKQNKVNADKPFMTLAASLAWVAWLWRRKQTKEKLCAWVVFLLQVDLFGPKEREWRLRYTRNRTPMTSLTRFTQFMPWSVLASLEGQLLSDLWLVFGQITLKLNATSQEWYPRRHQDHICFLPSIISMEDNEYKRVEQNNQAYVACSAVPFSNTHNHTHARMHTVWLTFCSH